jgi:hypothetical protein
MCQRSGMTSELPQFRFPSAAVVKPSVTTSPSPPPLVIAYRLLDQDARPYNLEAVAGESVTNIGSVGPDRVLGQPTDVKLHTVDAVVKVSPGTSDVSSSPPQATPNEPSPRTVAATTPSTVRQKDQMRQGRTSPSQQSNLGLLAAPPRSLVSSPGPPALVPTVHVGSLLRVWHRFRRCPRREATCSTNSHTPIRTNERGLTEPMNEPNVIDLARPNISSAEIIGTKGQHLANVRARGFPTPNGYVLTTMLHHRTVRAGRIERQLDEIWDAARCAQSERLHVLARKARHLISELRIDQEIADDVIRRTEAFGLQHTVAIRSSFPRDAVSGPECSGIHASCTNVIGPDQILARIRSCWASLFGERALMLRSRGSGGPVVLQIHPVGTLPPGHHLAMDPVDRVVTGLRVGLGKCRAAVAPSSAAGSSNRDRCR